MKAISFPTFIRVICLLGAFGLAVLFLPKISFFPRSAYGPVLHEEVSGFSSIRVRGTDSKRHLLFVSERGKEQLQSSIDLQEPQVLQVAYTRSLFVSFLFKNPQERILIVGLGGGGMIRFFHHQFPNSIVEVVEIDPAVVRVAKEYFETDEKKGIKIHTADAFEFLKRDLQAYDVIYMDAFLRPSVDRELGGKTARLKTVEFLKEIRDQLEPDGVLACNLIRHRPATAGDIAALREVFPTVRVFNVPGTGNMAVMACKKEINLSRNQLISRGEDLEAETVTGLPLGEFAASLEE